MAGLLLPRGSWRESKPPIGTQLDQGHPLTSGLIGAWPLNEGGGNRIYNAVDGRIAAGTGPPTWGVGPSPRFSGTTQYYQESVVKTRTVAAITVVARIYLTSIIDYDGLVFTRGTGSIGLFLMANGSLGYVYGGAFAATLAGSVTLNAWHTVAFVGRGATSSNSLAYVDGVSTVRTEPAAQGSQTLDGPWNIGRDSYISDDRTITGRLDYVYIWDRALSLAQINAVRADPYQMFEPPVWRRYFVMPAAGPTTAYKDANVRTRISGQGYKDADTRLRLRADAYKDAGIRFVVALGDQYARPMADVSNDNWTNELGGSTNLYASIDETTASDTDYIQSAPSPINWEEYKTRISDLVYPAVFTGHTIRVQFQKDVTGGDRIDLMVSLYRADGTTLITQQGYADIDALTTVDINLSELNVDDIPYADYPDLVIGLAAIHNTGGGGIPPWL